MGLFNSLVDLGSNVVKVVAAPVEIAADVATTVIKPVAEAAKDITDGVKSLKD